MPIDMHALARAGATTRLAELRQEVADLRAAFADLDGPSAPRRRGRAARNSTIAGSNSQRRKRKGMSAAARRAVGERMKAYWQKRKGSDAAPTTASAERTVKKRTMSAEARAKISAAQKERWRALKRKKS